jgi:RND family efflux transporter MFP subunit
MRSRSLAATFRPLPSPPPPPRAPGVRPRRSALDALAAAKGAAALGVAVLLALTAACGGKPGAPAAGGPPGGFAMPVQIEPVREVELRDATEYVATVKSRHSINVQPQVEGVITRIFVHSGEHVAAGAPLMQIDPEKQRAAVNSQQATRASKQAALAYARQQAQRMETLYKGGAVSRQALEEAQSALAQAQADLHALDAQVKEQEVQLRYYRVTAPEAGVVGDIPVRVGDRVTTSTLLTTISAGGALEVYIAVPIERAQDLRLGLPVEILGDTGEVLATTQVSFIAPQVENDTQGVLVKAPVPPGTRGLRESQFVRARVIWKTHRGPVVPVLAVVRVNGQFFVFTADPPGPPPGEAQGGGPGAGGEKGSPGSAGDKAGGGGEKGGPGGRPGDGGGGSGGPPGGGGPRYIAHQRPVTLGDVVGNDYVVLSGLRPGQLVVVSGVQKLADGMPVMPLPPAPPPGGPGGAAGPPPAGKS